MQTSSATLALTLIACLAPHGWAQKTTRVLAPGGAELNASGSAAFLSQDGGSVAFSSSADNLVAGDDNVASDVFVYDRTTQAVELVSRSTGGALGNAGSFRPVCSKDGQRVVFWSFASNLDPGDPSSDRDVYLFDRAAGALTLVSAGGAGDSWDPFITPNGDWIVFASDASLEPLDTNTVTDVYRYEVATGDLTLVSLSEAGGLAGQACTVPATVSNDGNIVTFQSADATLVAGDTNGAMDVFVRDVAAGTTVRVENGAEPDAGASNGFVSANGRFVAFDSNSTNIVASDTNGNRDAFVTDLQTGAYRLLSRSSAGAQGDGHSMFPRLSRTGSYAVFASTSTNLVAGDTNGTNDIFWHHVPTQTTLRVSVATDGTEGNDTSSGFASVSTDGGSIAFTTDATNLVPGDTTDNQEAMMHDLVAAPLVYCTAKTNSQGCVPQIAASGAPSASAAQPFDVTAAGVLNQKSGLFFYGLFGAAATPFLGGTLCVAPPLRRTPVQFSFGNVGPTDCSGAHSFDFNAWLQGGNDANLVVGGEVNGQFWTRDPQSSSGVGLTDAVRFVVCP